MDYIVYCDESDASGQYFSNFYGGLIVRSVDVEEINAVLAAKAQELRLVNEIKWQRVTANYLDKYIALVDLLFDLVAQDKIKIRIMFTHNIHIARGFDAYQRDHKYFLLYYQFVKNGLGLNHCHESTDWSRVRLYLDKMPDTKEKVQRFKDHLHALNKNPQMRRARIRFDREQIAEIDSKKHILAQSLDVVLGAMQFRLNDRHLEKPPGAHRRGKRTIAKEKLYKHINGRIREIYPNFNIGVSTSYQGDVSNRWIQPYRHWKFVSSGAGVDTSQGKKNK